MKRQSTVKSKWLEESRQWLETADLESLDPLEQGPKEDSSSVRTSRSARFGLRLVWIALVSLIPLLQWTHAAAQLVSRNTAGMEQADSPESTDKTLSPYFFVKSDDPSLDELPLKSTSAEVEIAGVIANIKITQVYKNEGKKALEAIYVFPASTRAAVYGMKMTIGDRTITAQIQKREEARAAYEKAKQEGKSASLLEQQRPNVFQMNVANILPGDEIKTELQYTELIALSDGIYEFVYPTVVGPRYSNQPSATAPPSEKWVQNPYLHSGEAPPYTFEMSVHLATGVPIQEMTCTSHKVDIQYLDPSDAIVKLDATEKAGGNRDFILKYRLSGDAIQSGLLLYEGKKENFFLLMVQPPKAHPQSAIPPREYVFIVDVSGSMHGFPLDTSKRLLKDLIGNLRPTDHFNVLLFAGASELMAEQSMPASRENIQKAVDFIARQRGGGGTELLPALKRALALPHREGTSRTVIIATDGYVAVETQAFDLIRKELGHANFFTFGIGSSVNRFLIEGIARMGNGEPFVVTKPDEAPAVAEKFRQMVLSPLLTQVALDFGHFQAYDVEPEAIPDVFAQRPVIVHGKWRGSLQGVITLKGTGSDKPYTQSIDVSAVKPVKTNSALRFLWARSRIAQVSDYNHLHPEDTRVREITRLGLDYGLLTAYTSFVAVDTRARREGEEMITVQQPLPLPDGVSDLAVGAAAGQVHMKLGRPMAVPHSPLTSTAAQEGSADKEYTKRMEKELPSNEEKAGRDVEEVSLELSKILVSSGLSEGDVRRVAEGRLTELSKCLSSIGKPQLPKEIQVTLTIDPSGKVSQVKITVARRLSRSIEHCLTNGIRGWPFSAPPGSIPITVQMTLTLK